MSATSSPRRRARLWQVQGSLLLTSAFIMGAALPAGAAGQAGTGTGIGTEDELDSADPNPVEGTKDPGFVFCARAKDGDFDNSTNGISAKYTINAQGTYTALPTAVYQGPLTITVTTNATFFVGPQGTHFGGTGCAAGNLGPASKVPAKITITTPDGVSITSCEDPNGKFYRLGTTFVAEWDATCQVKGNQPALSKSGSATSHHTYVAQQQPIPPLLVGTYTQS